MQNNLTKIVKHYEGLHDGDSSIIGLQPKMCPRGIWTEGYGRAMRYNGQFLKGPANKDIAYRLSRISTEEQANVALMEDLHPRIEYVKRVGRVLNLNENQVFALVSLIYNCGEGAFAPGKAVYKAIESKNGNQIKSAFLLYRKSGGKELEGLVNRRKTEGELFVDNQLNLYYGKQVKI